MLVSTRQREGCTRQHAGHAVAVSRIILRALRTEVLERGGALREKLNSTETVTQP